MSISFACRALLVFNILIAVSYFGATGFVLFDVAAGGVDLVGSVVVILALSVLAFGHWKLKLWALKATAALVMFANLLSVFASFSDPSGFSALMALEKLILITVLNIMIMLNYYFAKKYCKSGLTEA